MQMRSHLKTVGNFQTLHIDFSTKPGINFTSKLAAWHQRINNRLYRFNVNNA